MLKIVTKNFQETREEGKKLAQSLQGGEVFCLEGELGAGKTTFTQGILEELSAEKPYTSPTFVIMKKYKIQVKNQKSKIKSLETVCHIDTYRVGGKDILDLGWEEIIADKSNIVIIEWPERIKKIIPQRAKWISFKWIDENEREIAFEK